MGRRMRKKTKDRIAEFFLDYVRTRGECTARDFTGSDEANSIDIVMFPKTYSMYPNIVVGDVVKINGKVEKRFDKYQIIVNRLEKIKED